MMFKISGMDKAILGVWQDGERSRLVYGYDLLVEQTMMQGDLTEEEAKEHVDFNMMACEFNGAPIIVYSYDEDRLS